MSKTQNLMRWLLPVFIIVLSIPTYFATPSTAFACTQPVGGHIRYSIEERVGQSSIIVEGQVIDVYTEYYEHIAVIEVAYYYKGSGPSIISVAGYGDGAQCRSYVSSGQYQIFYLRENSDGSLWASYGSAGDAYIQASDENRAEVTTYTGQEPTPPLANAEPNLLNLEFAQEQATYVVAQRETHVAQRTQTPPSPTYTPTPTINSETATAFKDTFDGTYAAWRTQTPIPSETLEAATIAAEQTTFFLTATAFARDYATSSARERYMTASPTPRFNTNDAYLETASAFPTTYYTLSPTPSALPPAGGSSDGFRNSLLLTETQLANLAMTGGPDIFVTYVDTPTIDTFITATWIANNRAIASPIVSNPPNEANSNSPDSSDDNDVLPFLLGFLSATMLFTVLLIGYWFGSKSPSLSENNREN